MSSVVSEQYRWIAVAVGLAALLLSGCFFDASGLPAQDAAGSPNCGNSMIGEGEACDDGNSVGGDGCNAACQPEQGWSCVGEPSVCTPLCGDGLIRGDEMCDDGNIANGDGCSGQCEPDPGWTCFGQPSQCNDTCGNGVLDVGEECDDANLVEDDGCSPSCRVDEHWVCIGVPSVCTPECGDGWILGDEECDDGNTVSGDGCSVSCVEEPGWICTGVPSDCVQVCGDGVTGPGEQCDDGNTTPGDGCSPNCQQELGWSCNGSPSVCLVDCGDGLVVAPEGCDDGATLAGDGCSPSCQLEDFHACYGEPSQCVCVVYVDRRTVSMTPRTGASWQSALATVQEGIDIAEPRAPTTGSCEVWVAEGRYHIYQSSDQDTIALASDVTVYGGFSGLETWRSQRNISVNETIFDGTLSGTPALRVQHVVVADGVVSTGVDGVTVTNGGVAGVNGGGLYVFGSTVTIFQSRFESNTGLHGGGIYLRNATSTISNTTFSANSADNHGGGVYYRDSGGFLQGCVLELNDAANYGGAAMLLDSAPAISSSTFDANQAGHGGGIFFQRSNPGSVSDSLIVNNVSILSGGGLYVFDGSVVAVESSRLLDNVAISRGGGVGVASGSLFVESTVFARNVAQYGGGIHSLSATGITVTNCTVVDNTSLAIGSSGGGLHGASSPVNISNTILWGNSPTQFFDSLGTGLVAYCDVEGGAVGAGNIVAPPMFVDALADDYSLQPSSPCIDAADGAVAPGTDIDGHNRYDDPTVVDTGTGTPSFVDIGAYERQP